MADDRTNTLGTLNDLLFQELERLNGADLGDEDAKLRELVRDMWNGMCGYAHDCRSCEHYELYEGQRIVGECQYHARMRELGVEL